MFGYVILGLLAFFVLVYIVIYNGLVGKRNMVRNTFSTIDVMLKRRHDLIPNLVNTVKGFAKHEKEVFERVVSLRNQATSDSSSEGERLSAEQQLTPQLGRILAIAEDYPELKSNEQFLNLQRNLTETEEQISAARRTYNAAVMQLNNGVEAFPSSIVASQFGFERRSFFEVAEEERKNVSVDLS